MTNLIVLTPLIAGFAFRLMIDTRLRNESSQRLLSSPEETHIFCYPSNLAETIFFAAIIIPIVVFFLPDSVVLNARLIFNLIATGVGAVLFYSWAYLKYFRIKVEGNTINYGAFKFRSIDLSTVTAIKYHWVNNGMSLKLFNHDKKIVTFEGGISRFDMFAKCVKAHLSKDVHAETIGKAKF